MKAERYMYLVKAAIVAVVILALSAPPLNAVVSNASVSPSSITFTSSDPDVSVTGTPSTTNVSFKTTFNPASFTVHVKALSTAFTGCNKPPISAVKVTCSSASGVTCASAAALTSTGNGTTVATGSGNHNIASLVLTYSFQDSWNFQQGASCSLSVQVLYTEP